MAAQYVDPDKMVHPLRFEVCDSYLAKVVEAIENGEDWMSLEEVQAASDLIYDTLASKLQTHYGITTLQ